MIPRLILAFALSAALGACTGPRMLAPVLPEVPAEQTRCRMALSQSSPLVTEWPASEKANLEALLSSGGVTVAYQGCAMRVLPQCRVRGSYVWQRTTPSSESLEIASQGELYAKLPLGAANLEAELERGGKLVMQTVVAGQLRLQSEGMMAVPEDGVCAQATHVVGGMAVGAYSLLRSASTEASAGAGVTAVGSAGARSVQSIGQVRAAGDPAWCGASTESEPHPSCRSPIQVFLWPIPGRAVEDGPPGTVKTDFVSASANRRWDVYIDDQVVCTTPCTRWVDPSRPVLLRDREDSFLRSPDKVRLSSLARHGVAGDMQLRAHGTSNGQLATGITFTALGGMAVVSGVTFGSLGCLAGRSEGMCTAGKISLGVGALVTAASIWLILDALPRAEVVPIYRASLGTDTPVQVRVGPGFVLGSF